LEIMSTASSFLSFPANPAKLQVSSLRDRNVLFTSLTVSIIDMYLATRSVEGYFINLFSVFNQDLYEI